MAQGKQTSSVRLISLVMGMCTEGNIASAKLLSLDVVGSGKRSRNDETVLAIVQVTLEIAVKDRMRHTATFEARDPLAEISANI